MTVKPVLVLDWDGVIAKYEDVSVTSGFFEWADKARSYFNLVVHCYRSNTPEGIADMKAWLAVRLMRWNPKKPSDLKISDFTFTHEKPAAFVTIDDRAIRFMGDWSAPWLNPDALRAFKPWNVK
jgi:hypothetical protein